MANSDIKETNTPAAGTGGQTPSVNSVATSAVSALGAGIGVAGALGFNANTGFKVPMLNPLHKYASYTQIFTLAILTPDLIANPEKFILKKTPLPIILRSAGGNPANRIKTPFGKFDFMIDELEIKSIYGFTQGLGNTNATLFDFTVIEPFSMGMFPIALNTAAQKVESGGKKIYNSFMAATFLLKIEFMGADQNGNMIKIPNTDKFLPIQFRRVDMSVKESGATYKCQAHSASDAPALRSNSKILTNITVKGSSVQEIVQRGPQSLQAIINSRLRQTAKDGDKADKTGKTVTVADEVVIIFPAANDDKDAKSSVPGDNETETKNSAAAPPKNDNKSTVVDNAELFTKLKIARGDVKLNAETLIESKVNAIGAASMGYTAARQAKTAPAKKSDVVPQTGPNAGKADQAEVKKNPTVSEFTLPQDTTIQGAINQIIMASDYGIAQLRKPADETTGMKSWWRIETEYYELGVEPNKTTGQCPKLFVYKVVPYMYHHTNFPIPGASSKTFEALFKQCIKVYNYIFTGKNQDILKFDLNFDSKFLVAVTNDFGNVPTRASDKDGKPAPNGAQVGGDAKRTGAGGFNYSSTYTATHTSYNKQGGGGDETPEHRSVRMMYDALTYGYDLQNLEMDIVGDPYYLTSNGVGNYSAPADAKYMNILKDGSINFQNGEVDIAIIFKTPLDLNASTGLYTMQGAAIGEFSGLYKLQTVTHRFKEGQFTQTIKGVRRPFLKDDTTNVVAKFDSSADVPLAGDATVPDGSNTPPGQEPFALA